jgi:rod shape-determining protein MreC
VALVDLRRENLELSREVARLRGENRQLRRAAEERARLQALLRFQRETPAETIAARVIGRETTPFFRVTKIQINRGEKLVRPGMPVLTATGLVGRIHRVFGRYADVLLAVDAQSAIDVIVDRTRARGVVRGLGSPRHYGCKFEYLARTDEVAVGDLVVTSGIGGKLPKDLVVGKVSSVVKKDFGVFQKAEVEPAVDFSKLEEVLVMVAPPLVPESAQARAAVGGAPAGEAATPRGGRRRGARQGTTGPGAPQSTPRGLVRVPLP